MNTRQRRDRDHFRGRHAKSPQPDLCFGCAAEKDPTWLKSIIETAAAR